MGGRVGRREEDEMEEVGKKRELEGFGKRRKEGFEKGLGKTGGMEREEIGKIGEGRLPG